MCFIPIDKRSGPYRCYSFQISIFQKNFTMSDKKLLILDTIQIQQKITRIAYQIWEDNLEEKTVVIAGIVDFGFVLAERLQKELEQISGIEVTLMKIKLDKQSSHLHAETDVLIETCSNKVVILVDDVLNSGRTLAGNESALAGTSASTAGCAIR